MNVRHILMLATLALVAATAGAHHSTAGIYQDVEVQLKGKVKSWRFINPHPTLKLEVIDEKGVVREWDVSYGGSAVTHLKRRGYTADTFKVGDTIIVKGHPTVLAGTYGLLIEGNGTDPTREDGRPYP